MCSGYVECHDTIYYSIEVLRLSVCAKIHRLGMHQRKVWCNWCNWCTDDGAPTVCFTKVLKSDSKHCNIMKSNNILINVSVPPKSPIRVVGCFLELNPFETPHNEMKCVLSIKVSNSSATVPRGLIPSLMINLSYNL